MTRRTLLFFTSIFLIVPIGLTQKKRILFQLKDKQDIIDSTGKHINFNNRLVIYTDVGTLISPLFINVKDAISKHHLNYRINHGIISGLGFSYRGIGLRLSYMIVNNIENKQRYGETSYIGTHLKIPIKSIYAEGVFYHFKGFSISKANQLIPNYTEPNLIRAKTAELFIEMTASYFLNKNFDIKAFYGRSGHYIDKQYSFYVKPSLGYFKITNGNEAIVPEELLSIDEINQINSNKIGAGFVGFIPGIAYVTRLKNWQLSGILGIGAMMQYKFYRIDDYTRNFMGISPKLDAQIDFGYNPNDWFIMISNEFKFSHLKFPHLDFKGLYYNIRLTGGYRFKLKEKKA